MISLYMDSGLTLTLARGVHFSPYPVALKWIFSMYLYVYTLCTHLLSSLLRKDFISLVEECHGEQCGIIPRIDLAGL